MIVVYEVTSGDSFSNVKRWLHEIDTNCENVQKVLGEIEIRNSHFRNEVRKFLKFLVKTCDHFLLFCIPAVGNKADDPERRVVLEVDARRFAETMKIPFFETSAKENINVEEVKFVFYLQDLLHLNCQCELPVRRLIRLVHKIELCSIKKLRPD